MSSSFFTSTRGRLASLGFAALAAVVVACGPEGSREFVNKGGSGGAQAAGGSGGGQAGGAGGGGGGQAGEGGAAGGAPGQGGNGGDPGTAGQGGGGSGGGGSGGGGSGGGGSGGGGSGGGGSGGGGSGGGGSGGGGSGGGGSGGGGSGGMGGSGGGGSGGAGSGGAAGSGGSGGSGANLLTNPGFETGDTTGWTTGGTAAVGTAQKHTGTYGLALTAGGAWVSRNIKPLIAPDVPYRFRVRVLVSDPGPNDSQTNWGTATFRLSNFQDLGTQEHGIADAVKNTGLGWQTLEFTATIAAATYAAQASLNLGVRHFGFIGSSVIDDLEVVRQ